MTPQKQLIKHDPENGAYGDCQRTCVAVILDLHPSEVPHFCDDPTAGRDSPDWWHARQTRWLAERGLAEARFAYYADESLETVLRIASKSNPHTPMILCGTSRLGVNHSVVVLDGEIVCDPSGNGIVGPPADDNWEISVIGIAA